MIRVYQNVKDMELGEGKPYEEMFAAGMVSPNADFTQYFVIDPIVHDKTELAIDLLEGLVDMVESDLTLFDRHPITAEHYAANVLSELKDALKELKEEAFRNE